MEQRWKKLHFMWSGKRLLALFVSVCLLGMMAPVTVRAESVAQDADGTYLIRTTEDLVWFAQYVNQGNYTANAILMADVGFIGGTAIGAATVSTIHWNTGYSVTDVTGYQGTFDGNGYTITMPGNTHLFAAIDGGTVKNLTVTGGSRAIVDYMKSGSILFCTNRSDIKENTNSSDPDKPEQDGHYIGSIVNIVGATQYSGSSDSCSGTTDAESLIQGCTNYGSIDSPWCVGGIVGAAIGSNITIDSCANYGNINLKNGRFLGGIVSNLAEGAKVTNCYDQSQRFNDCGGNNGIYYSCTSDSSISNCFHVNGANQSDASQVTGLTDEVVSLLNQGSNAVVWSSDGIAKYGITLSQTEFTYNGLEQKPELYVVDSLEQKLTEGTDYDIEWPADCINAGSKKIVVTFKGSYSGTITKMYSIKKQAQDAPNVSIDTSEETVSTTAGMEYSTDRGNSWMTCQSSMSLSDLGWTGSSLQVMFRLRETDNYYAGNVQDVTIPARPNSNLAIDNCAESVTIPDGYRYNTTSADYSGEWTEGDGSAVKIEPDKSIFIYKTATESNFKSNVQTLTAPGRGENFSAPAINYEAETLATTTAMEYKIVTSGQNDSDWVNCTENMAVTAFGWSGSEVVEVKFRAKSTGSNYASAEQTVTIPARLSAPSGLQEENESGDGKKDGKITGLDRSKSYQYRLVTDSDSEWENLSSSVEITGLTRGHYVVRYAAGNDAFASAGSDSITLYTVLGTPTAKWDSNMPGKATWDKVENASGYSVQLYKNGNEDCNKVGDTINVASDTTKYDFTSVITSVGSYAFKVKAIGDGESYVDSKEDTSVCLFTVSFDTNGAGAIDMQLVAFGEKVAEPTAPTKTGYSFGGWYSDSKCLADNKWDFATSTVSQVMTLFAKWEANDYTVTLDAKGGTIADGKNVTGYTYGSGVILPSGDDVTYTGYTFAGWYESEDYSGTAVTEISSINIGSKTFYAKWLSQNADVTYASVSGVEGTISGNTITVILPYGSTISKDASEVFIKTMEGATHTAFASDDSGATWTFTVTAEDGTTTANYSIKVFVAANPADGNIADVEAAKSVIEGYDWTVAQATANTQEAVKTWIEQQLANMNLNGASYTVSIKDGFTAALTGTFSDKDGSNGNFGFNVTISKGVNTGSLASNTYAEATASVSTGTITAMAYTDNGGSTSDGSSYNTDDTPSTQPEIKGAGTSKGWSAIVNKIVETIGNQIKDTETIKEVINIDMKGTSVVPKTVFDTVKGKDIALVFDMGEGISWTVNGKDVTDAAKSISLGVKRDTNVIPAEVINKVTRKQTPIQMSLEHDGEFGFTATLTMKLESKNKGLYANLYYYNPKAPQGKELEFICADEIDESGNADLVFSHASDYTVVIDYAPMDGSAPTAETQAVNSTAMNKKAKLGWKSGAFEVKWGNVNGAEGYDIYATTCGRKFTSQAKVASVTADQTSATIQEVLGSQVSPARGYKVMVKAYRMADGKKQYLGKSMELYTVGNGHKTYTNAGAMTPSVKTLTLTVGKTKKVRATITKEDSKKKLLPGKYTASKRYFTADETIATVDEKGNVTAHRKGKTTLYIKAANGVTAKVPIIIK